MTSLSKNGIFNKALTHLLLSGAVISTVSLYTTIATAAPIYKVVDEKTGQVTFTDRPQGHAQEAGKQVSQMSITTGNESSRANESSASSQSSDMQQVPARTVTSTKADIPVNYQLAMVEPSEERAYRRPAQSINVSVQVNPSLQAGDRISIYLDNNEVAQGLISTIGTVNVLPGEHEIKAVIKNERGEVLQQVARTVYVIQNTTALQNKKKMAKQLLAYQNLPWHQKVMLKMRQKQTANP
ncbi:DUF4124 domain-containing protein [Psychrobacter sp. B38]|uniref:DUF4124 domain-containing protein n=1 Tax=Psychrobacter sp. B38 TaxID=3143538 RepID=UPI00320C32DD